MSSQPLFGQDSSPHKTSNFISIIVTVVLWLCFGISSIFITVKTNVPKYEEIQIVLSSEKLDYEKAEAEALEESSSVPMMEEAVQEENIPEEPAVAEPVVQEQIKEPVKQPEPVVKKEPEPVKKTEPAPVKKETPAEKKVSNIPLAKSVDDMLDFNSNTSSSKKNFDWSQFDDMEETPAPQVSQKVDYVQGSQSGISGSAATSAESKNQSVSSQNQTTSQLQKASATTTNSLNKIAATSKNYTSNINDSLKAVINAKSVNSSDGKVSMEMSDGSSRVLLEPSRPEIKLSAEAAKLLDHKVTVTIKFRVIQSGNVPEAQIIITPESSLPAAVREEIYSQLSKWRFESASNAATASFEYTVDVK